MDTQPSPDMVQTMTMNVLATLQLASHYFPPAGVLNDGASFDYVIVGGGTAGCILASRLSENPDVTVAMLETGTHQPFESLNPSEFPWLYKSAYDYNFKTEQDSYTGLNLQGKSVRLGAGKMLSGSSGLYSTLYTRSNRRDMDAWASAAKDNSWGYDEMLKYYIKSERLEDQEILDSPDAAFHGKDGRMGISRARFDANVDIIKSFQAIGLKYQQDFVGNKTLGIGEPLVLISNGVRQSTAESYLLPVKDRKNLFVYTLTTASKIIFDEYNNAVGVEAYNMDNQTVTVNVNKEVLIAAGAIKGAQLLLLSGIGPKNDIESWGIEVVSDLPVGQAVRDKVGGFIAYKLKASHKPPSTISEGSYPTVVTIGYKALISTENPDYFFYNTYVFKNSSSIIQAFCSNVFNYNDDICNRLIAANANSDLLISNIYNIYPYSTGMVKLQSTSILVDPWVYMGYFRDSSDMTNLARYFRDFTSVVRTSFFKTAKAETIDLNLGCNNHQRHSYNYWMCHAKATSNGGNHVIGTCPMGTVVDSKLKVNGVQRLRVVDSAAIPTFSAGTIVSDVIAFAEKAADMVKADMDSDD